MTARKKKEEPMVRTSVQLPKALIDRLPELGVESQSEALRLALERYFYVADIAATWIESLGSALDERLLARALEDFGPEDFRTVVRVLPELIGAAAEEMPLAAVDPTDVVRFVDAVREMNPIARMALLDASMKARAEADQDDE